MPNPLQICTNLLPIGTYLCVLGLLHAAGRPLVTTGVRDYLALVIALAGLAINGPLALVIALARLAINWPLRHLLHSRILPDFLAHSHWIGLGLYLILVAAWVPRFYEKLVIYNCPENALVVAVRTVLEQSGMRYQEVPSGWILAARGVSIEVDAFPALHNVTLDFRGMHDRDLYQLLQRELPGILPPARSGQSWVGVVMAGAGGLVLALPVWMLARDPQSIAGLFRQVLETW